MSDSYYKKIKGTLLSKELSKTSLTEIHPV